MCDWPGDEPLGAEAALLVGLDPGENPQTGVVVGGERTHRVRRDCDSRLRPALLAHDPAGERPPGPHPDGVRRIAISAGQQEADQPAVLLDEGDPSGPVGVEAHDRDTQKWEIRP